MMKRDMDLIRLLLFQVEGEKELDLSDYSDEQKLYHQRLLLEAGLVHGSERSSLGGGLRVEIKRLTWEGHEFLDAARNDSTWNKAKERISKLNVSVTLPIMVELLIAVSKERLGLGN